MPYRYNPFTKKLDIVDTTDGPGPVISLTGNSGGAVLPTAGNINVVGSGGVNIVGDPGSSTLTVTVAGSGMTWQTIGSSQTLKVDNGYFVTAGATISLALPATSAVGDTIVVSLDGAGGWQITQGAGQQIRLSGAQTTSGAGGSLATTAQGDSVELVCSVANTRWNVVNAVGNITVT